MEKLFAVYLGGRANNANIEVHDVVFVIGKSVEDTFEQILDQWFGKKDNCHIDAYVDLSYVENYKIKIKEHNQKTIQNELKLFCINFGGYVKGKFYEHHEFDFFVAETKKQAIDKAKHLAHNLFQRHLDDALEIDGCLEVSELINRQIHIEKVLETKKPKIVTKYIKLSK